MAFEAADGAPMEVLYDRMKIAVQAEAEDGTITPNLSLVAFLDHYGSAPRACRLHRAKTKGKVERLFRYIRQDFFLDRVFRNRDDPDVQFPEWRSWIGNYRPHGTLATTPCAQIPHRDGSTKRPATAADAHGICKGTCLLPLRHLHELGCGGPGKAAADIGMTAVRPELTGLAAEVVETSIDQDVAQRLYLT